MASSLSGNGNGTDTGDGLRIPASLASLNGLTITNSKFDNNVYGMEAYATVSNTILTNVAVTDSEFNNNLLKGAYFERLASATFTGITVSGNGTGTASPAGFDINLKFATYSGISFDGATFTNNGTGTATGAGLTIKARGDSQDSSTYQAHPAHLSNLTLTDVSISGSPVDLALGDNIVLNGHPDLRLPNTLNINFLGHVGAEFLQKLPQIAASTGSACHEGSITQSPVLCAMGVPPEIGKGAVRLSVGRFTTEDEIDRAADAMIRVTQNA